MAVRMRDNDVSWLGNIAWYSLGNLPITADQLYTYADECGLELVSRPTQRTADAFKVATSAATASYTVSEGVTARMAFTQVRATEDVISRNLMLTIVDTRAGTNASEKVAEVKFQRPVRTNTGRRAGSERIKERIAPGLAPVHAQHAAEIIAQVHRHYADRSTYLPEGTVRKTIRDVLDVQLMGLAIRRSGVYFILPEHLDQLQALQAFVERIDCDLHFLPLVDDAKQRALLRSSLRSETVVLAEAVTAAVAGAGDGVLPGHVWATLTADVAAQRAKVAILERHIGPSGLATGVALTEAEEALSTVQSPRRA